MKIGPLTETNNWSEKGASDEKPENVIQESDPQDKVVDVAEKCAGKRIETAEKEHTDKAEISSKQTSETKIEKVEPVEVQIEQLVRIDKEKCEFTTPVMITRIGPVKPQMEELVEVVRIDKEKCEFTTPVMITKIGPVKPQMEELVEVVQIDKEKCESPHQS